MPYGQKLNELRACDLFKDTVLPLRIIMQYYTERDDPWHRHKDFCELVLVCSGHAYNKNKSGSTMLRGGNIFLLSVGSVHRYYDIQQFWHYNILFSPDLLAPHIELLKQLPGYHLLFQKLSGDSDISCSQLLSVDDFVLAQLIAQIEQIRNESAVRKPGWQAIVYFNFLQFLTNLLRHCAPNSQKVDDKILQIGRIIRIMEENSKKSYSLQELANSAHMSVSSFRQHFKTITGLPPIAFLIKLRVKKALLLLCAPVNITQVAEQAGFPDNNYFARQFKTHTGLTPKEFQKKYRTSPDILNQIMKKL